MNRQRIFNVVVIDDKEVSCNRIAEKLPGARRVTVGDTDVKIEVKVVHVRVRREDRANQPELDSWTFKSEIVGQLREAAAAKPDLLLVDYFYVDDRVSAHLKKVAVETEGAKIDTTGRALTPYDLRQWVETSDEIDGAHKAAILKGLFGFSGPLYLHTYTPQELKNMVGPVDVRMRRASLAFPHAEITAVDTRSEFFSNDVFDNPKGGSRYNRDFYAYQLATYFDQVAQKEIFRKAFSENRFIRVRRSSYAVSLICAVGAAVGFASGWAGTLALEFARCGRYLEAVAVCLLCLLAMLVAGFTLTFWFEALMRRLVREE